MSPPPSPAAPVLDKATFTKVFICSALLGTINNNAYSLVFSVAQDLAGLFGKEDAMSMFSLSLLFGCFGMTLLHSRYAFRFSFGQRIFAALSLQTGAYLLLALASMMVSYPNWGFVISLVGTILTGFSQAIGEVNNISRLHHLPATLIGAWGMGTGLAGIIAPLIYTGLINAGLHRSYIMLLMNVFTPVYWFLFRFVNKQAINQEAHHEVKEAKDDSEKSQGATGLSMASVKVAMGCAGFIIGNLVAVYFLEYWILSGFLDRATIAMPADAPWIANNVYRIAYIAYNAGVLISRTSVTFFQIKAVWIPTVLQAILLVFWACEASMHFIREGLGLETGMWVYVGICSIVGLMGGCSYSNCMFQIQNRDDIPDTHRELSVNLGFAASNIGIALSSIVSLIIANTIMTQEKLYG